MDRRDKHDRSELNLLPMMNLVSLLIPLLLMGTQLVALSSIDIAQPATAPAPGTPTEALSLVVRIEPDGFYLEGAEDVFGEASLAIPCAAGCDATGDWPHDALVDRLVEVKVAHPSADEIAVIPDSRVTYQVIVKTLDATREYSVRGEVRALFPTVRIGSR